LTYGEIHRGAAVTASVYASIAAAYIPRWYSLLPSVLSSSASALGVAIPAGAGRAGARAPGVEAIGRGRTLMRRIATASATGV
jgi:hypothetical protein